MEEYKLLVFDSTHHALKAENLLKDTGNKIMMVPIPPEISADCGTAIRLNSDNNASLSLLKESNVKVAGYYRVVVEGLEKRITKL